MVKLEYMLFLLKDICHFGSNFRLKQRIGGDAGQCHIDTKSTRDLCLRILHKATFGKRERELDSKKNGIISLLFHGTLEGEIHLMISRWCINKLH